MRTLFFILFFFIIVARSIAQIVIGIYTDAACKTLSGSITVPFAASYTGCAALSTASNAPAQLANGFSSPTTYYGYSDLGSVTAPSQPSTDASGVGTVIYAGNCPTTKIYTPNLQFLAQTGSRSTYNKADAICANTCYSIKDAAPYACPGGSCTTTVASWQCTSGCKGLNDKATGSCGTGAGTSGSGSSGTGSGSSALSGLGNIASCGTPTSTATSGICPITGGASTDPAGCAYANCLVPGSCNCAGPIAGIVIGAILGILILVAVLMRYHVIPHPSFLDRFFGDARTSARKGSAATAAKSVGGENPMTRK